jgi:hypothetical protein
MYTNLVIFTCFPLTSGHWKPPKSLLREIKKRMQKFTSIAIQEHLAVINQIKYPPNVGIFQGWVVVIRNRNREPAVIRAVLGIHNSSSLKNKTPGLSITMVLKKSGKELPI